MKKKISLSGINAKTALAIVALSGALLTGCYKDDGLDVSNPAGNITLPAATYTIAGTVIDAETLQPITAGTVSGDATATVTKGGFSIKAEPKTYNLTVKAEGYDDAYATVVVEKISDGQAVVYSPIIAMKPQLKGTYKLSVNALDEDMNPIEDPVVSLYDNTGKVLDLATAVAGGTYIIKVEKKGYITKNVTVELPAVAEKDTPKTITVVLTTAPVNYIKVSGEVQFNGVPCNAKVIKMTNKNGAVLGLGSGYVYNFEVPENEFTEVRTRAASEKKLEATFTFTITDENNKTFTFNKNVTVNVSQSGEEEPGTGEFQSTMDFSVELGVIVGEKTDNTKLTTLDYFNETDNTQEITFKWTNNSGIELIEAFKPSTLSEVQINSGTALYSAISTAFTMQEATYKGIVESVIEDKIVVPAQSWAKEITTHHYFTSDKLEVKDIKLKTISGDVTTEEVVETNLVEEMAAKELGAKIKSAAGDVKDAPVIESIGHGHSHGHGHGNDLNAGGGIVEAE